MIPKCQNGYSLLILFVVIFSPTRMSAQDNSISNLLETILDQDQEVRILYDSICSKFGYGSMELNKMSEVVNKVDSMNQLILDSIYSKHGWLFPPCVSLKASTSYFYITQHGSCDYQRKYEKDVEKALKNKIITEKEYCFFVDRLAVNSGKYQKYGTQFFVDPLGNEYFIPIDSTLYPNLDIAYKGEALDFQHPDILTIFIHAYYKESNTPLYNAEIMLDNKIVGRTNPDGFFFLKIRRDFESHTIVVRGSIEKKMKLRSDKERDFYDFYYAF